MKIIKIILFILLFNKTVHAETLHGWVIGISDGDTITVLDNTNTQFKIRLAGIDAPEKKQDFGNASKKSLSDLVYDQQVTVDWHKEDRYGRIVGKVIRDNVDINLEQIKKGMAWFYRNYQNELVLDDRLDYLHAEEDALKNQIGIWSLQSPIPPWDFRKIGRAR